MRLALGVEYNGSAYHGWQRQTGDYATLPTVQSELNRALAQIANHPITSYCAGRTDAGVHALGQVVHFDTDAQRTNVAWVQGVNTYLPQDIAVRWAQVVDDSFHARFSAVARCYAYVIANHPTKTAILSDRAAWYPYPLNVQAMQEASKYFLGEQDFTSLRSAECSSRSNMRNIEHLSLHAAHGWLIIVVQANAFLQRMVRNLVGVLLHIGSGRVAPQWAQEVLAAKDRRCAAKTAAAQGLYLLKAIYPEHYNLPDMLDYADLLKLLPYLAPSSCHI